MKRKIIEPAPGLSGAFVYCGPTINGVAKQFTVYSGVPPALQKEIEQSPIFEPLLLPLEKLAEFRKQEREKAGFLYTAYIEASKVRRY